MKTSHVSCNFIHVQNGSKKLKRIRQYGEKLKKTKQSTSDEFIVKESRRAIDGLLKLKRYNVDFVSQ